MKSDLEDYWGNPRRELSVTAAAVCFLGALVMLAVASFVADWFF